MYKMYIYRICVLIFVWIHIHFRACPSDTGMPLLEEYPIITSLSRDKWQFKILIYVGIGKSIFSIYNFRQNFRFGFFPSSLMGFFTFVEWPTNDLWLFTATLLVCLQFWCCFFVFFVCCVSILTIWSHKSIY